MRHASTPGIDNSVKNVDSPKTPGGISKSLLTPCRRVGLSKKWKKTGPSPFISPLANDSTPRTTPLSESKPLKRKRTLIPDVREDEEDTISYDKETGHNIDNSNENYEEIEMNIEEVKSSPLVVPKEVVSTPKSVVLQRKKSKKLITDIAKKSPEKENVSIDSNITKESNEESTVPNNSINIGKESNVDIRNDKSNKISPVLTNKNIARPVRQKSIKKVKEKSPNNLTKECIVVIQKKLLPRTKPQNGSSNTKESSPAVNKQINLVSQAVFDSDSDEVPLSTMKNAQNNEVIDKKLPRQLCIDDDEDFISEPKTTTQVKKLEDKKTSTGDLKSMKNAKKPRVTKEVVKSIPSTQSSNSFDDDDDFDFNCKKTILIRKTYDKVAKPSKAKSTGSITQRDIDELKARIEMKKNLLLTKVVTEDTEELHSLIKKWRKGCQDAISELLDLMKLKFPDRQNMDYSEILQTLRIPSALVGYDSDNDCFTTPDDASIILSKFQ